jgi:hypothetical protein
VPFYFKPIQQKLKERGNRHKNGKENVRHWENREGKSKTAKDGKVQDGQKAEG